MKRLVLVLVLVASALGTGTASAHPPSWSHARSLRALPCHAPVHGHKCPTFTAPDGLPAPGR